MAWWLKGTLAEFTVQFLAPTFTVTHLPVAVNGTFLTQPTVPKYLMIASQITKQRRLTINYKCSANSSGLSLPNSYI